MYDIAVTYGNDDLALQIESYLNSELNFSERKTLLYMKKKGQIYISKIPKGLFNQLVQYF